MRRTLLASLVVLGLLVAPLSVLAANPNSLALKLGAYIPGEKNLGLPDPDGTLNFKAGFNGEIAYGYTVMPNLGFELGVGWFSTKDKEPDGTIKADVVPVTLNVKGILPMGMFEPYALAGGGVYITKFKNDNPIETVSKSKTVAGFQLGLGANYNFMPNLYVGAEGKYLFAKPKYTFDDGTSQSPKLNGFQLTANVGCRF